MLSKEFIDNLSYTDEKIIDKYIKSISKEIAKNAELYCNIQEARKQANLKYGKQWRERLTMKKIYNTNPFGKMSYY